MCYRLLEARLVNYKLRTRVSRDKVWAHRPDGLAIQYTSSFQPPRPNPVARNRSLATPLEKRNHREVIAALFTSIRSNLGVHRPLISLAFPERSPVRLS